MTWGPKGKRTAAQSPTIFMTSAEAIAAELGQRCYRKRSHQPLLGGRAGPAARYPEELCEAICRGLLNHLDWKGKEVKPLMRFTEKNIDQVRVILYGQKSTKPTQKTSDDAHEDREEAVRAWDDITGEELDRKALRQARPKELGYTRNKNVWGNMRGKDAQARGLKILRTRWIDINTEDEDNVDIRSRLVAKEMNKGQEERLFAATQPEEALRMLVSRAATITSKRKMGESVIMINKVARAFFEARITREVYRTAQGRHDRRRHQIR
jgi:hypothetical protein